MASRAQPRPVLATIRSGLGCILTLLSACDGGGSTQGPAQAPQILGNLAAETTYATTDGNGTVDVSIDPSLQNTGLAYILNGQRYALLNPFFIPQPPSVQEFFAYHELGHHYCDHMHRFGFTACQYGEYEADAFATRVQYSLSGPAAVTQVAQWFQAFGGSGGDQTHRTGLQRAQFMNTVLAMVQADPSACPEVPYPLCQTGTYGHLTIGNPLQYGIGVYANGIAINVILAPGQQVTLNLQPGIYTIVYQYLVFPYSYVPMGTWQVGIGEETVMF